MKGSLRERRPGHWELRVFAGEDSLTGRKHYRTRTFRGTKRQAQSALAVLVTEVDGGVVEPKKCTVAELLDAWPEHIENVGRSPSTLYGYRRLVRQLPPGFLAQPLAKVTPKVVDDLYRFLARQTIRKPATVLRSPRQGTASASSLQRAAGRCLAGDVGALASLAEWLRVDAGTPA